MINIKNKKISIPLNEFTIGSVGDNATEFRTFEIDRYYNDIDLADYTIIMEILPVNKTESPYCDTLQKTVEGDKIKLLWEVKSYHLKDAGDLKFNIWCGSVNAETETKIWQSYIGTFSVKEGIDAASNAEVIPPTAYEQVLSTLSQQMIEHNNSEEAHGGVDVRLKDVESQLDNYVTEAKVGGIVAEAIKDVDVSIDESNLVHKTGEEEINGGKIFNDGIKASVISSDYGMSINAGDGGVSVGGNADSLCLRYGAEFVISGDLKVNGEVVATLADLENIGGGITEETDPTVPDWAKLPEKPTYTAEEVGALPSDTPLVKDDDIVHKDGDEDISGRKTFYGGISTSEIFCDGNLSLNTSWGQSILIGEDGVFVNDKEVATKLEIKNYIDEQTEVIKVDVEGLQKQLNEEAHFKGYLSTNAKIQALEATPNDFAYSAESGTKWVYDVDEGWKDTGTPVPDQLTPASDSTPLINGVATAGQAEEYARGDHRHPTDTTRVSVEEFNALKISLEEAFDNIIAIQNRLIGGDAV